MSLALLTAAGLGSLYLAAAALLVGRFARQAAPSPKAFASITILKPLHGREPALLEDLESFCRQDYPGPVQIVFGVQDPADPAASVAQQLIARHPGIAFDLVVDPRQHGTNRKVSNLINMAARIRHDVVVLADSDIRVPPDYLARLAAELERPGVGAVTCLYHGLPSTGFWSRLGAMAIDTHFLPNVVMGLSLGRARPCFGSTIALRRATLTAIGGFAAFADVLADDYAVGEAVRAAGRTVVVPAFTVGHSCAEADWRELWRHELRWARTIRSVDPIGYAGSVLTHPLPLAALAGLLGGGTPAIILSVAAVACRIVLCRRVERAFDLMPHSYWLLPVRDFLSFAVFLIGFVSGAVTWQGHAYRVVADGTLLPDRRSPSP